MISWDINAGNLLVTTGLGAVAWGLKRLHSLGKTLIREHGETIALVDAHSEILERKGLTDGRALARVRTR